ncbi:ABC transporter permease [Secundilactobacillus paracollinoides]|uniref:ABC transporter permease n=1 Tax=Secundilactobacillus paracollinoides TaxID=240427 RepID=A0A1B2IVQ7_9LACO|nr:ABC transporter permease [Secundilactobacillus paracollinoides]ANZ60300.1 ABC transporter permease [Secundilactobacillus paracollinoides]ANZ62714.1 ABC transporter permease [Secundilactobacillus paracollinoides]ANZ66130.1 ABC transporter permease [Secundilactobacillus paracollinoides]KRL75135.1 multidrug ABC superfamily ATP binding cassette transporter, permease protein [Secundilactobacillus paracollinoides DSM 15502 = JCM 11969]
MRTLAIVKRIITEMFRDKRTLALMFLAPLLILTLMYFLFDSNSDTTATLGVSNVDSSLVNAVDNSHIKIKHYSKTINAEHVIRRDNIAGVLKQSGNKLTVTYQNSEPSKSTIIKQSLQQGTIKLKFAALKAATTKQAAALKQQQAILKKLVKSSPQLAAQLPASKTNSNSKQSAKTYTTSSHYLYGSSNSNFFIEFLPILLGFFVFLFVFLISGISLLHERTTGTLSRLLATPIRRSEIITGYLIGYGLFAVLQTLLLVWFAFYVFQVTIVGNFWLLVLINLCLALVALTMGIFISTFANSEFQMIQFIPIVVIPQILFSGLVPLSGMATWLQWLAHIFPLYYGASSLTNVATKGATLADITPNLLILIAFLIGFTILNIVGMKRYRRV